MQVSRRAPRSRWPVMRLALWALLVGLLLPQVAPGQIAMPSISRGPSDLTELAVTRSSMSAYCDLLGMDGSQRELALELHAAYLESYREMAGRFEQRSERLQQEARESRDVAAVRAQTPALMRELMSRMRELEDGLFADLSVLAAVGEDDERWAAVQRKRRREQAAHTPSVNGDAVDLVEVAARAQGAADWPPEVAEALLRYELELDAALSQRQRLLREAMSKTADLMEASFDPERQAEAAAYWEPFLEKMQELSLRAKSINLRAAAEIEQLLAGEAAAAFAREGRRAMWPGVYRESYPQRLLAAARRIPDVSSEQKERLGAIEVEYEAAAAAINERWARLIDEREKQGHGPMGGFAPPDADAASDEAKAKRQRAELDRSTADRIVQVLTSTQQARLPGEDELDEVDDG